MAKHYSPITNSIEPCVGADRCKYGNDPIAVHFEDHDMAAAYAYMERVNEEKFGILPENDSKSEEGYSSTREELLEVGQIGPLHSAADFDELIKNQFDQTYDESLRNAKYFAPAMSEDIEKLEYSFPAVDDSSLRKAARTYA